MVSLFNTSAYKIITQSFYNYEKYVSKSFLDLTDKRFVY